MVNFESKDKNRAVFLLSVATSVVLMSLFLLGTLLANIYSGETSYSLLDVVMGCIFVYYYHNYLTVPLAQGVGLA